MEIKEIVKIIALLCWLIWGAFIIFNKSKSVKLYKIQYVCCWATLMSIMLLNYR